MVESACDRCGRPLGRMEPQYIATIDLRPTVAVTETDEDPGDRDHLMELHEMLEAAQDDAEPIEDFQPQEFVLCHECCCRLRENPLSHDLAMPFGFSEN